MAVGKQMKKNKIKKVNYWLGSIIRLFIFILFCSALSCQNIDRNASTENRLLEILNNDSAKPLFLHDHDELMAFLKDFPRDAYNLYSTKNGFSYFIEKDKKIDGIKKAVSSGQVWEEDFIQIMAKYIRPGSTVIDAGAFIGTHTLAMAKLTGRHGRVYAFEPQKKVFRELVFNLIENNVHNVTPLRFALGEDIRIVEMEKPVNGLEGLVKVGQGGDQVELRTLDSFSLRNVSFIKIDVEGYEANVIEGSRETIANNRNPPILIEIWGDVEKVFNMLEDFGYSVTPLPHRDYLALPAPDYLLGSTISFANSGNADQFKSGWWSSAEPWGSWTIGNTADIVLPLTKVPKKDLVLNGMVKAYINEKNPQQEIAVIINGRQIDRWIFRHGDIQQRKAAIPVSLLQGFVDRPILHITFQMKNPISPSDLKFSDDKRLLGLAVYKVIIQE
jgi:FkbM family methyltransferase